MDLIPLLIIGTALTFCGIALVIWKKRISKSAHRMADSAFNMGVKTVERITVKFPELVRHQPESISPSSSSSSSSKDDRASLGLQGNLSQTPLHDLLQYLSLGHKTGILELTCGRRTGRVAMKQGRVSRNSYRGKEGIEALFMMMDLTEGDFEFSEHVLLETDIQTNLDVVDIIMLWMDRKPKKKLASN